jgi:hypothetical protein
MRTPDELIAELDSLAKTYSRAALVVGYTELSDKPRPTPLIWADDPNRRETLQRLILEETAMPVGFIGCFLHPGERFELFAHILDECVGDIMMERYLAEVCETYRRVIGKHAQEIEPS